MLLPDAIVPLFLRLTRANTAFMTPEGARAAIEKQRIRPESYGPPTRLRPDVVITAQHDGACPVYTVSPRDAVPAGHVLYAHGGGWVHEISAPHWTLVAQIAAEARMTVTVPIWKLLPSGTAAQANELMLRLHDDLQRSGDDVVLAGDSAGGQIALSAALTLRDRGMEKVRTILISPALDLRFSHPRMPAVLKTDPWLGIEGTRVLAEQWRGDLPLTDPVVSPLLGEMRGLGPMLVFTGTRDILNPDAHLLLDKARAAGVEVTFVERRGAVHVFPLLPTPVGRAARAQIIGALDRRPHGDAAER